MLVGDEGFGIFYVPADAPGVTQGKPYRKAGMSGDWNGNVWFDHVRIPREFRAHGPGTDALAARAFISSGNVGTAAQCIGVMRNIYELLVQWCDTREVGGTLLKGAHDHRRVLAEVVVAIETSRAETYLKARMLDRPDVYGPRHTPSMLARTRVAKLYVSDQLTRVARHRDAVTELCRLRAAAVRSGARLLGAGIHPAQPFGQVRHLDDERYGRARDARAARAARRGDERCPVAAVVDVGRRLTVS